MTQTSALIILNSFNSQREQEMQYTPISFVEADEDGIIIRCRSFKGDIIDVEVLEPDLVLPIPE